MDITPVIPKGFKIIKSYGDKSFTVNDEVWGGSIIITPYNVSKWDAPQSLDGVEYTSIYAGLADNKVDLLLIGCGLIHLPMPKELSAAFRSVGINTEIMTTGAACRTYNVLLSEDRNVAAALIAV